MNLGKLFNSKNIGMLMSMVTGGTPDTAKLMAMLGEMITDENVKSIVAELHLKYAAECAKLGDGHELQLLLRPDAQRGLVLHFMDWYCIEGSKPKADYYKTIYLAEITAADIQAFFSGLTAETDRLVAETDRLVAVIAEKTEELEKLQRSTTIMQGMVNVLEQNQQLALPAHTAENSDVVTVEDSSINDHLPAGVELTGNYEEYKELQQRYLDKLAEVSAPEAQPEIPVSASIADNAASGSDNEKTADNDGQ